MANDLTVIIPIYNEEKSISSFHASLHASLAAGGVSADILYVNDGSTDGSAAALDACIPKPRILKHDFNRGYGAAIKTGIRHIETEYVAIIDCDGTYETDDIPRLYALVKDCDMVIGARSQKLGLNPLSKKILRAIASYAVEYPIPDLNSGLRVFRREVATNLFSTLPNGFSLTSTITLGALYFPYMVRFIPIAYNMRTGKSKIKPFSAFVAFTLLIFRTIILFNPLKFFLPPTALFAVVGCAFLVRDIVEENLAQTSVLMIVNAFICLAIGLLAEAIRHRP